MPSLSSLYSLLKVEDDVIEEEGAKKEEEESDAVTKDTVARSGAVDDEYDSRKGSDTTYYSIAHTLKEVVTEQPSIIAFGNLKEYQVGVALWGQLQGTCDLWQCVWREW